VRVEPLFESGEQRRRAFLSQSLPFRGSEVAFFSLALDGIEFGDMLHDVVGEAWEPIAWAKLSRLPKQLGWDNVTFRC
jgi:hypothetical protein